MSTKTPDHTRRLPFEWDKAQLGAVAVVRSGGTPSRSTHDYWGGDIPWVTTGEVKGGTITAAREFITRRGLARSAASLESPGTVLVALYGQGPTRGRVAMLGLEAATNQACAAIVPKPALMPSFLFHYLNGSYQDLRGLSNKGSQDNLSGALLKRFPVPVPPKGEQRAIAEALSHVDGLLGSLEALTAKNLAIKQAAVQQLLTGKIRLPGFSGEWETKRLGEIGHFLKGSGVKRDDARSGPLACVRYGEIYTTHHDYVRSFHSWISSEVAATATRLQYGDLLFAGSGETKEEIGKSVAIVTAAKAYAGGDIIILRPSNVDPLYFGYALNMSHVARQKASLGQGDAVVHISAAALAQVSLAVPSIEEQAAIATILSDMDAEIAALEARRDKTRAIKQGMMQQLLTGRVRLVKPEVGS